MNVEDSAGGDIDWSSAARTVQDRRYDQLERLLGGVRAGVPRCSAGNTRHQLATYSHRFTGVPLQDQVRRQRRTSREEERAQSI